MNNQDNPNVFTPKNTGANLQSTNKYSNDIEKYNSMENSMRSFIIHFLLISLFMCNLNADDIVIDSKTNLMWQDTEEVILKKYNFENALNYCKKLNLAGYQDWRVPNGTELASLVDSIKEMNTIDIIKNKSIGIFWTSTLHKNKTSAYTVWFQYSSRKSRAIKSALRYVRCVRGKELKLVYPYHLIGKE